MEAEICDICKQEKTPLPATTKNKKLPVFVCTTPAGKAKMSCDGDAYKFATRDE